MNIGEKIKKTRKNKKMTQTQLAKSISKSERMIQKYENGEVVPSIENIKKIASVLEVNVDDLLSLDRTESSFSFTLICDILSSYQIKYGYWPDDIFKILSVELNINYESFNCFIEKKEFPTFNENGEKIFTQIENPNFDKSKELPVEIQKKLLHYLAKIKFSRFTMLVRQYRDYITLIPELNQIVLELTCENTSSNSYDHFIWFLQSIGYNTDNFSNDTLIYLFKKLVKQIGLELEFIYSDNSDKVD